MIFSKINSLLEQVPHSNCFLIPMADDELSSHPIFIPTDAEDRVEISGFRPMQISILNQATAFVGWIHASLDGEKVFIRSPFIGKLSGQDISLDRDKSWPGSLNEIAVFPICVNNDECKAYLWLEKSNASSPRWNSDSLGEIGKNLSRFASCFVSTDYESSLNRNPIRSLSSDFIAAKDAASTEVVVIYGESGLGKRSLAHLLHQSYFPNGTKDDYREVTPSTPLHKVSEWLTEDVTVVFSRIELMSFTVQLELLRCIDHTEIWHDEHWMPRKARIVAICGGWFFDQTPSNGESSEARVRDELRNRIQSLGYVIEVRPVRTWSLDEFKVFAGVILQGYKNFDNKEILGKLREHHWPGNIPELSKVLASMAANAKRRAGDQSAPDAIELTIADLPTLKQRANGSSTEVKIIELFFLKGQSNRQIETQIPGANNSRVKSVIESFLKKYAKAPSATQIDQIQQAVQRLIDLGNSIKSLDAEPKRSEKRKQILEELLTQNCFVEKSFDALLEKVKGTE